MSVAAVSTNAFFDPAGYWDDATDGSPVVVTRAHRSSCYRRFETFELCQLPGFTHQRVVDLNYGGAMAIGIYFFRRYRCRSLALVTAGVVTSTQSRQDFGGGGGPLIRSSVDFMQPVAITLSGRISALRPEPTGPPPLTGLVGLLSCFGYDFNTWWSVCGLLRRTGAIRRFPCVSCMKRRLLSVTSHFALIVAGIIKPGRYRVIAWHHHYYGVDWATDVARQLGFLRTLRRLRLRRSRLRSLLPELPYNMFGMRLKPVTRCSSFMLTCPKGVRMDLLPLFAGLSVAGTTVNCQQRTPAASSLLCRHITHGPDHDFRHEQRC